MEFYFLYSYIIILTVIFIFYIFKEIQEIIFLNNTLISIIGKKVISCKNDLIKIKNFLNNNISYDTSKKYAKRPILRHSALYILKSKYGFCGENARVAIKLLLLGNIKCNRIYLTGKKWGHVVIENKWGNNWFLFDGHYDPLTKLEDSKVSEIKSNDLINYPNGYKENPYVDFSRIKLFTRIKFLKSISKLRLPSFLIYFFESPSLIKSIFLLILMLPAILILILNN